jgi:hypothetical protein
MPPFIEFIATPVANEDMVAIALCLRQAADRFLEGMPRPPLYWMHADNPDWNLFSEPGKVDA